VKKHIYILKKNYEHIYIFFIIFFYLFFIFDASLLLLLLDVRWAMHWVSGDNPEHGVDSNVLRTTRAARLGECVCVCVYVCM
jgi:hypothetical protein